jgi:hypothetical protein
VASWNQVTYKKSTNQIIPNLSELQTGIQKVALKCNDRFSKSQGAVEPDLSRNELTTLTNLRACVQTAVSVVSSASTVLAPDSADINSEFKDCFPIERSEAVRRWILSNTVHEGDGDGDREFRASPPIPLTSSQSKAPVYDSGSDSDIDTEIIQRHRGRWESEAALGNFEVHERLFRKCISKMAQTENCSSSPLKLRLSLIDPTVQTL